MKTCELCDVDGGEVIIRNEKLRVVLIDDANYPGFCRVIWNAHVKEMTDLPITDRSTLMQAVCKVEQSIRDVMRPDKINLASLGNVVPHLHWHVIPRYQDDAHFPKPIWADAVKPLVNLDARVALLTRLKQALQHNFSNSSVKF